MNNSEGLPSAKTGLVEIAKMIKDHPEVFLHGMIGPYMARYNAGDYAGAIGYALPDIVSALSGGVGVAKAGVKAGKIITKLGVKDALKLALKKTSDKIAQKEAGEAGRTAAQGGRVATEAEVATNFQQNRRFWSADPIEFNGNRVYQRNDLIDPNQVSEWTVRGQTVRGTNLERMASGRAPIGPDGNSVNLHHLTQRQDGAIAEVTQTIHSQNYGVLHMPNTVPSGINRSQFNTWSRNYWKDRAASWGQ